MTPYAFAARLLYIENKTPASKRAAAETIIPHSLRVGTLSIGSAGLPANASAADNIKRAISARICLIFKPPGIGSVLMNFQIPSLHRIIIRRNPCQSPGDGPIVDGTAMAVIWIGSKGRPAGGPVAGRP